MDTCNPRSARMKILQILTCHPILSLELCRFATKLFHNVHVQTSYYHTAVFTQQNGVVLINWQYSSSNMGLWKVLIDIYVLVLHTHRFWNVVVSSVMRVRLGTSGSAIVLVVSAPRCSAFTCM